MSSTIVAESATSKKRKHESGAKESAKKKRKHKESAPANAAEENDESITTNALKEMKKKKDKRRRPEELETDELTSSNGLLPTTTNGERSTTSQNPEKKKKKKRRRHSDQFEEQPAAALAEVILETKSHANAQVEEEQADEEQDGDQDSSQEEELVEQPNGSSDEPPMAVDTEQLQSTAPTSFSSIRTSLYLPIPAIGASSQLSALLAIHISPLLLSYFPPVGGVLLAYQDPVLSARPESGPSRPLLPPTNKSKQATPDIYSVIGEEFGASWVWLTLTLLVFKPAPGDELQGWTNAISEGFIGLVSYNYFQTSITRSRIPTTWIWEGPSRQTSKLRKTPRKGKLNDSDGPSQEPIIGSQDSVVREDDAVDGIAGRFIDEEGTQLEDTLKFRVIDLEMIQAQEKGQRFALQLEGSLLDEEGEHQIREEERVKWETRMDKRKSRSRTPGTPMMSGGLPTHSRAGSIISTP